MFKPLKYKLMASLMALIAVVLAFLFIAIYMSSSYIFKKELARVNTHFSKQLSLNFKMTLDNVENTVHTFINKYQLNSDPKLLMDNYEILRYIPSLTTYNLDINSAFFCERGEDGSLSCLFQSNRSKRDEYTPIIDRIISDGSLKASSVYGSWLFVPADKNYLIYTAKISGGREIYGYIGTILSQTVMTSSFINEENPLFKPYSLYLLYNNLQPSLISGNSFNLSASQTNSSVDFAEIKNNYLITSSSIQGKDMRLISVSTLSYAKKRLLSLKIWLLIIYVLVLLAAFICILVLLNTMTASLERLYKKFQEDVTDDENLFG